MWFGMGQVLESPYLSVAWVRILHARHRVDGSIERCTDDLGVQFSLFEIHNSKERRMAEIIRDATNDIDSINRLTRSRKTRGAEIPDSHIDLLDKKSFAHLSSLGPDGEPQSHPVWFDAAGGQLLISTGTDRQKYRNIQRDPRVSVSILDPDDPYRYLEVRGRVVEIQPDPQKTFLDQLARKYLDQDIYPYEERRSVERVIIHIQPDHVVGG
jgi:PPOX class probable F420-dependent enzyme